MQLRGGSSGRCPGDLADRQAKPGRTRVADPNGDVPPIGGAGLDSPERRSSAGCCGTRLIADPSPTASLGPGRDRSVARVVATDHRLSSRSRRLVASGLAEHRNEPQRGAPCPSSARTALPVRRAIAPSCFANESTVRSGLSILLVLLFDNQSLSVDVCEFPHWILPSIGFVRVHVLDSPSSPR